MTTRVGSENCRYENCRYEERHDRPRLPEGWSFSEVVDVALDGQDRVCVFNRGQQPVMIFEADGTLDGAWGEGMFTRPHGLTAWPDGALWAVDDDGHCVRRFTWDGELQLTIGTPGQGAEPHSGEPFNRPTKVDVDPASEALYIADGYGNARVHKYSPEGEHLFSWGEFGTSPGEFNLVHSVCTDDAGRVYWPTARTTASRSSTIRGPTSTSGTTCTGRGLLVSGDRVYIGQLHSHLDVNAAYPNIGACVTSHDLEGNQLARLGGAHPGERPGEYTAPHGLAVDSRGDLYVGEVSWSAYDRRLDPPRLVRCFREVVRV